MMNNPQLMVGDLVAIRGDLRVSRMGNSFVCAYLDSQLIADKYLKHSGHGGIWLGIVEEIKDDMVRVANGWRGVERYEVMLTNRGTK